MKPTLYYQVKDNCNDYIPAWDFCAAAMIGAVENKIHTIPFVYSEEVMYNPYNILVGSVEETLKYLDKDVPIIDHSWTYEYLKREVNIRHIEDIQNNEYPIFIKPARKIKGFTGFIALNKQDALANSGFFSSKVISQEIKDIKSEYRVYVNRSRGVIGIKHYLGDPYESLDKDFVTKCVNTAVKTLKELSFTLDFGIDNNKKTFLIEVNDGWSIGNYGLDPHTYYHFIKERFLQLTGVIPY